MPGCNRRAFLCGIAAAGAKAAHQAALPADGGKNLPRIHLGSKSVTRLILGGNPIEGYSHSVQKISDLMREYFTLQRTTDLLLHAEEEGIATFQSSYSKKIHAALLAARERGSKLDWICLHSAGDPRASLEQVLELKPIAIVHHGNRTDECLQSGHPEVVRDYVRRIKDLGLLAGISTHSPAHLERLEDFGWENDFYMTCLYYLTRTLSELHGERLVYREEPFVAADPERMTARIRQVRKPCLAFKLLAAGRNCATPQSVAEAFRFAYSHIKRTDACIVGMFPILSDEVRMDAELARTCSRLSAGQEQA